MTQDARFTPATDILRKVEAFGDDRPSVPFAWRKGWLAQRSLVAPALAWPWAKLRRIPGLRFKHLTGLCLDGMQNDPFDLAINAEAIQVDQTGSRLRLFSLADKTTLKAVRADTRYGPQTEREYGLRQEIAARTSLPVPKSAGREDKDGLILVREQLVEGRIFNVRRDRNIFCIGVIDPLVKFYQDWGVTMAPLAEAIAPLAHWSLQGKLSAEVQAKLGPLLSSNPLVAVSLSHNDVLSSNLAVGKSGVWFLDWGLASPGLCGRDFWKTGKWYAGDPAVRGHIAAQAAKLHRGKLTGSDLLAISKGYTEMNRETVIDP